MNTKALFAALAASLLISSCEQVQEVSIPAFPDGGLLRTGTALTRDQLMGFEGMFTVVHGSALLGPETSVRTSPGTISILTDKYNGYAVLGGACLPDGRVVVEGYWQYPTESEAGLVRLFVDQPDAASALCGGMTPSPTTDFSLSGSYGQNDDFPTTPLSLRWNRELKPWRGRFFTIAHHGACGATDHCGASPNSLESIRLSERIGSNAAEVDVRMTKDGKAILFHDPTLSTTLVQGLFCNGTVADMTLAELRGSCTMHYGEAIPTLQEALDMMVNETELEGTYLDEKTPEGVLPSALAAASVIADLKARNEDDDPTNDRHFVPVIGIPKAEVLDAWHAAKTELMAQGLEIPPCLIEYDPNLVISEGCQAWGPTWTLGPQPANVQMVRAAGAKTFFWTINQSDFVDSFLTQGQPDGIISDRAAMLFHRYQEIGITPPLSAGAGQ
jgi:glycerophosphoryl diester phosphodiesterase